MKVVFTMLGQLYSKVRLDLYYFIGYHFKSHNINKNSHKNYLIHTLSGLDLPKEEDFFQFQYLRVSEGASQTVLGASIPFQLRKPKNEELCTVQVLTL